MGWGEITLMFPVTEHSNNTMGRRNRTTHEARVRNIANDFVRILRTPLHFDAWAAIEEIYARPYMEMNRPVDETDLYDTLRMANEDNAQVEFGYAAGNIYCRAPLKTAGGANGHYPRRAHEDHDRRQWDTKVSATQNATISTPPSFSHRITT